jgi:amino acid transporter
LFKDLFDKELKRVDRTKLKKEIGLITLVSLGAGNMIGSGIFAFPAVMGSLAGPGLLLGILIAGCIALCLALIYAELGSAFPISGGPYSFPCIAMGDLTGFLMGWGYFLYLFIGTAGIIDIFIVYLGFYFPGLAVNGVLTAHGVSLAVIALWIFTLINLHGVRWGGLYSVLTMIGRLIPLFLFFIIGSFHLEFSNFVPFFPFGWKGVALSSALFFWAYTGFESIVVPIEEIKKPSKTIPWALFAAIFLAIIVYALISFVYLGMVRWEGGVAHWETLGQTSFPLAQVAQNLHLPTLAALAAIGAILATGGSGGSWVLIQGRMPYAMAQDHFFWSRMAKVSPKYGTPAASLIFASFLTTIILIAITNFPSIALIAVCAVVVPYSSAALSLIILRKTKPEVERPFRLPKAHLLTLLGFIFSSYLIYWASWPWNLISILLIFTGYPAFFAFKRRDVQLKRTLWLPVYLVGILIVAVLGDSHFVSNNFTHWRPLGYLTMPFDLIVLALFSSGIYFWAYFENTKSIYWEKREHSKSGF